MKLIPIRCTDLAAKVSDKDYVYLKQFKWYLHNRHPGVIKTYAVRNKVGCKTPRVGSIYMHREILGLLRAPKQVETDHKDGDTLNNMRSNLRVATSAQNKANKCKQSNGRKSKYKGVTCFYGRKKPWTAFAKGKYLGYFYTEVEAARAYDAAARVLYGKFARTNFKD